MPEVSIRPYRSADDAPRQYELWLSATADLPRAWRSCLKNVQHQLAQATRSPGCRLYAEDPDGGLRGYIGTHPPFEWIASQHGPPARSLGWAIPFGYPWTHPLDEALEAALYDEMIRTTPETYAEFRRDIYIQRFRQSWSRHIAFLERRGWRLHDRLPLFGREVRPTRRPPAELSLVTPADLPLVSDLTSRDDTSPAASSAEDLGRRLDGGWIVADQFWRAGDHGAFAIEHRGASAAVTFFAAAPDAWDRTLEALDHHAAALGVREIYFTHDTDAARRRQALERRGFREIDAGVYYVREAD